MCEFRSPSELSGGARRDPEGLLAVEDAGLPEAILARGFLNTVLLFPGL